MDIRKHSTGETVNLRGMLLGGTDAELMRRRAELSNIAGNDVAMEYLYEGSEYRRIDTELALRGLPRTSDTSLPETEGTDDFCGKSYALHREWRQWVCSTTAGVQVPLIGGWRVVLAPTEYTAHLCVPERVVIIDQDDQGRAAVSLALAALLRFADTLAEFGADARAALGVSRAEIADAAALATEAKRPKSLQECQSPVR